MAATTGLGYDPTDREGLVDFSTVDFLDAPTVPEHPYAYFGEAEELVGSPAEGTAFSSSGTRTYVRRFQVILTKTTYGAVVACNAPGVPRPYSLYDPHPGIETDRLALCVDLSAVRKAQAADDQAPVWIVTARYSTDVPAAGPNLAYRLGDAMAGPGYLPWLELPDVEFDAEIVSQAPQYDLDGWPYFNSAGVPFVPAHTTPLAIPVLVVTKNFRSFTPDRVKEHAFVVNQDEWLGPPGSWLMEAPRVKVLYRGPFRYYRVTFRIKLKTSLPLLSWPDTVDEFGNRVRLDPNTWQPILLDAGMHETVKVAGVPLTNQPVPITNMGFPVNQPVLLDGFGSKLRPPAAGDPMPDPVYLQFRQYPEKPFGVLLDPAEIQPD